MAASGVYVESQVPLPGGSLTVASPSSVGTSTPSVMVTPGVYRVIVRGYALGEESDDELSDHEILSRDDLERYEIILFGRH
ncbi:MAG: hypothetical protein AAFZ38_05460 [Myxococcota bacterium]